MARRQGLIFDLSPCTLSPAEPCDSYIFRVSCSPDERPPRLHPGFTQEVAANESQRGPKAMTQEALIYEALFVAPWLQS